MLDSVFKLLVSSAYPGQFSVLVNHIDNLNVNIDSNYVFISFRIRKWAHKEHSASMIHILNIEGNGKINKLKKLNMSL